MKQVRVAVQPCTEGHLKDLEEHFIAQKGTPLRNHPLASHCVTGSNKVALMFRGFGLILRTCGARSGGLRASQRLTEGGKAEWRNMQKREDLAQHRENWQRDGLNSLKFSVQRTVHLKGNEHVTVYTVDL